TRWPRDWSSDVCSSDLGLSLNQVRMAGGMSFPFRFGGAGRELPAGLMITMKKFVHGRSVPFAVVAYAAVVRITGAAQIRPPAIEIGRATGRERAKTAWA